MVTLLYDTVQSLSHTCRVVSTAAGEVKDIEIPMSMVISFMPEVAQDGGDDDPTTIEMFLDKIERIRPDPAAMTTVTPGGNVPNLDWLRDTFVFLLQMIEQILAVDNFHSDRNNDCDNTDAAGEGSLGSGAPLPGGFAGTEPPEVQTFSAANGPLRSSCSSPTRRGARAPGQYSRTLCPLSQTAAYPAAGLRTYFLPHLYSPIAAVVLFPWLAYSPSSRQRYDKTSAAIRSPRRFEPMFTVRIDGCC